MTRRNIELALLIIASPIVLLLFAMYVVNDGDKLNVETLAVPLGLFAAFLVAHFAIRKLAPNADPAILPIVFALSGIGIAFVTRLAPEFAGKQVVWLFAGVFVMVLLLFALKNLDKVANYKYTLMILGVVLLLSPMLPVVGQEIYGSRIWLSIAGISFQPGEIAKILIVLFLAAYLAQNREMLSVFTVKAGPFHIPDMRTLMPLLVMWGISMLVVVFEKDLGSACVVFLVFLTMLYVASGKKSYLVFGLGLALLGVVAAYFLFGHVQVRVSTWIDPFADPNNTGYQLVQAIYSLADGGMFGTGIGRGMSYQIPVVESDFIFVAIAEETGFLGACAILLLFLSLAIRGLVTAARAKSDISSFVAVGATAILILQAFIIVGGVTKLIPLTGLTLPFVSQGGTSLLAGFILVGLLLRCGDEGTGAETELTQGITTSIAGYGVLGRVSLGKRITGVMILFSVLFALLIANLTMVMILQADYYQNLPGNNHTIAKQEKSERGTISTSDGVVLAKSVLNEDTGYYKRKYPAGTFASHIVGYSSSRYGNAGIEASYNDVLQGNRGFATWSDYINSAAGISQSGNDVVLTVDSDVQRAAENALSGYKGACVVLNPKTGEVLALASSPAYSPSKVSSIMKNKSNTSLYNRATQALYVPGSTFKMLTLATALEENVAKESDKFKSPGSMKIGGAKVRNFDGNDYGTITLRQATELSSNTVFGQVGVKLGPSRLVKAAEEYGFNDEVEFDLALSTSLMPDPDEMTTWETAWAAIGQPVGQHESPAGPQVTVLQMAMVGSAIANKGTIMTPYLVDSVYDSNGTESYKASSSVYSTPISKSVAKRVRNVLKGVVENGTGTAARVSGVSIAGKTGTAETGKAKDDSWFVGMGPTSNCSVVVAIVLEQSDEGMAAARSANVMATALKHQGKL